jgi:hypothetical protein
MMQVFMLNVAYDVGVKTTSLHLMLIAALLLAPEWRRLANLFVLNRPAGVSVHPPLCRGARANRIALAAQVLFGLWLTGLTVHLNVERWREQESGREESPLYGIWDVEQFTIDGQMRPPLLTDPQRWRRAIFEFPRPGAWFEKMDDSFAAYRGTVDTQRSALALTKLFDKRSGATFAFQRPVRNELILDGEMDGHRIHAQLRLFDRNRLPLVSHRRQWGNAR